MFRWVTIIGFSVIFISLVLQHFLFPSGYSLRSCISLSFRKLITIFSSQKLSLLGRIYRLVFLLALLSFLVLLLTGFGPLVFGCKLQGYLLMLHATCAPIFISCAAIIIFLSAGQYTFNSKDIDVIRPEFLCNKNNSRPTDTDIGVKIGFWLLAAMTLPVTLTIILCMLPLFGTEGQEFLYDIHRWSALCFGLLAVIESYMLIRVQTRKEYK